MFYNRTVIFPYFDFAQMRYSQLKIYHKGVSNNLLPMLGKWAFCDSETLKLPDTLLCRKAFDSKTIRWEDCCSACHKISWEFFRAFHKSTGVWGLIIVLFCLSALAGQELPSGVAEQPVESGSRSTGSGHLEWLDKGLSQEEEKAQEKEQAQARVTYGIIQQRSGWFEMARQDCTQLQKRQAGQAKLLCDRKTAVKEVQEYILRFTYLPDENLAEYPFGVPLDFILRLDWVFFGKSGDLQPFWQVELVSRSGQHHILMYRKKLQLGVGQNPEADATKINVANDPEDRKGLAKMQEELEIEASKFLQQYLQCLRQGRGTCN